MNNLQTASTHLNPSGRVKQAQWNTFLRDLALEVRIAANRDEATELEAWGQRLINLPNTPMSYRERVMLAAALFRSVAGHVTAGAESTLKDEDIAI